ncbi:peptide-methionine (S)-S-oxide reductase [Arachidicoccus rhizosphaerae]|uniref:Peptide methionine sulfoxide reductase MsrA n=1 Tax=Arachidicoccus rhizosphaerae TaxID=551991 RepID=A0A1H4BGT1_9BACT|nr:peptide-methionine (S)-S-oxide reductase MsrA [Arachidicoccus rhizosphaerae]SEA47218.1 peptide-methionine (S)-S-oxide reductase [Arachidicoccus rhizosphaerae]
MNKIQHSKKGFSSLSVLLVIILTGLTIAVRASADIIHKNNIIKEEEMFIGGRWDTATFAAGCFWCVEAQFSQLKGVKAVISGFTGGKVANPSYKEVCTGLTGHAEACNIIYDPSVISFKQLLAAFFVAHDPTSLDRQGADVGTQYRSAIFYHNPSQKQLAEAVIRALNQQKVYDSPIVTEVTPYSVFYKAADYHQDYYNQNKGVPYCQLVIKPKLDKFRKVFKSRLK